MLKDVLLEYGAPVAVSLTLAVGGMAISNSERIAIIETENKNMVQVQQEMIREIKDLTAVVIRVDTKLEVYDGEG